MPVGLRQRISEFFSTSSGTASQRSPAISGPAASLAETRSASSLTQPSDELLASLGLAATAAGVTVTRDSAMRLSAVYACTNLRAKVIASLPVKLYRRTPTGRDEVPAGHPAGDLFRARPNGGQTSYSFRLHAQTRVDLAGNYFARIVRDGMYRPIALVPLAPGKVRTAMTAFGDAVYQVDGSTELVTRADVLHLAGDDLADDGLTGIAPLARMREALGLAQLTADQAARFMANDATPPIAISLKEGKLSDEQVKNLRSQWTERYGGRNRGMPAVLQNGATVDKIGFDAGDAQLLESRKFDVEEIARFYGVPLALIQSTEKSTSWGSGIYELVQGFVKFTVAPICVAWESVLDLSLLTEEERAQGYYFAFNLEGLLRGDLKARSEALKILREAGVINADQWAAFEELPELPDGLGKTYLTPLNYAINGRAPESTEPAGDEQGASKGSDANDEALTRARAGVSG